MPNTPVCPICNKGVNAWEPCQHIAQTGGVQRPKKPRPARVARVAEYWPRCAKCRTSYGPLTEAEYLEDKGLCLKCELKHGKEKS